MYCCAVHSTVLCVMWYLLTRTYSNTVHIGAVLMYFVLLTVLYVRTVKTKCWLSPKQFSVQAESQTRTKNTLVRVLLSAWTETSPTGGSVESHACTIVCACGVAKYTNTVARTINHAINPAKKHVAVEI